MSRLGSDIPKQYIEVNGKMIITYSLEVLCGNIDIDGIVLVVADEWKDISARDFGKSEFRNKSFLC